MSGHTPGPWVASSEESPLDFQMEARVMSGEAQICYFIESNKEAIANASLIAAAPELLEALMAMVEMMDSGDESGAGSEWHTKARAAIAKATGEGA